MPNVYIYVVDRDFGFAPNPFHGICTLATCKSVIRRVANINDWIIGVGGSRLDATGRCIYAMKVTSKITFNEYWNNPLYKDKKPVRNGSKRMVVGDNIYNFDDSTSSWNQCDSHHSNSDGTINQSNLLNDTQTDKVLISNHFFYFGSDAPAIPSQILNDLNYKNGIGHRVYNLELAFKLIDWLEITFPDWLNSVKSKPFDFNKTHARYSAGTNKITV